MEYALQSIEHAGCAIAVVSPHHGVAFVAEKRLPSPLLDRDRSALSGDKMFMLDDHLALVVAGMTSDSYLLVEYARRVAQSHRATYHEGITVDAMAQRVADLKQSYTQYGGLRPFGVSFLLAGYDEVGGFQLFCTEPSGNYSAWRAHAIGNGSTTAQSVLKGEWREEMSLQEGVQIALKAVSRVLDVAALSEDKVEVSTLSFENTSGAPELRFRMIQGGALDEYIAAAGKLHGTEEIGNTR